MAKKRIKLSQFAGELRNFREKSSEELRRATKIGVIRSVPDLVRSSPVDTGEYANSWDFTETEKTVLLGNFAPHAAIIEKGARPFTPPISPLLAWAKRVLQDPSQPPEYSPEVWSLARGTQNKIARIGMKPRHVLENQIPKIIENIRKEITKL
jgi:hypothetical protein